MKYSYVCEKGTCRLKNSNDVLLDIPGETNRHAFVVNAVCCCGMKLLVAPSIFHPQHEKGNPIIICEDNGVHAFEFKDLVIGTQTKQKLLERG